MSKKPCVLIGLAWYGGPRGETAIAMMQTYLRLSLDGQTYVTGIFDCSSVGHARARLVARFMAMPQCTHLWMVDADMLFEPEAVLRLLEHDVPFVGVPGPDKRDGRIYVGAQGHGGGEKVPFAYNAEKGLVQVGRIGACFLLIRRDAIERLMEHYPELHLAHQEIEDELRPYYYAFFETKAKDGWWPTEDYAFCDLLRGAGIPVLADPWIELGHIVTTTHRGKLMDTMEFE